MFIKTRKSKDIDPFVKEFLSVCKEAQSFQDTTHLRFMRTVGLVPEGIYEYKLNGTISLDGELITRIIVDKKFLTALRDGDVFKLQHTPTYNESLEAGTMVNVNGFKTK